VTLRADQEELIAGGDRDVKVQLFEPFALHGQITIQAPDGSPTPRLPTVRLGPSQSGADSSGAFTLERIYPGAYRLFLTGIPNGFYLDSVDLGGSEAAGEEVRVVSGGTLLTIRLKYGGGSVQGSIEDCAGCAVALIPGDRRFRNGSFSHLARCSRKGGFEISWVRPGQYYILAVSDENFLNMAALEPYLQRAALITVVDNETVRAEVPRLLK
jgi:hypothetical protein